MVVNYGKMPLGLKNICEFLKIQDDKAIFLHSLVFGDDDFNRKKINYGKMIYAEIFSFACCDGPLFASSYYNDRLVNYLDEVDIINKNNLVMVGENKKTSYPYNSVSRMLKEKIITDKELRNKLDGYTVVSSYLGRYDEDVAKMINGKTLMTTNEQIKFNSKYYMRKFAEKYNFSFPVGEAFREIKKLNNIILNMKKKDSVMNEKK